MILAASLPLDFSLPLAKQAQPSEAEPQRPAERGPSKSEETKDFERLVQEQAARTYGQGGRALASGVAWSAPTLAESAWAASPPPLQATGGSTSWWRPTSATSVQATAAPLSLPPPPELEPLPLASESLLPLAWVQAPLVPPLVDAEAVVPLSALQHLPGVQAVRWLPSEGPGELTQLQFELQSPHLGALSMRLEHRGGQVGLELLGHSPDSVAQLDAHLHEIAGILQAHGLTPTHLRVTQASGAQGGRGANLSGSEHRGSFLAFMRRRPAQGEGLEAEEL